MARIVNKMFEYSTIYLNIYLSIVGCPLALDVNEPVVDCLAKKTNRTFHKYTIICFPRERPMAVLTIERVDSKVSLTTLNPNFC